MQFFRNHPFVRLLIFQLTGIFLANFTPASKPWLLLLLLPGAALTAFNKNKALQGLLYSLLLCALTVTISFLRTVDLQTLESPLSGSPVFMEAMILDYPTQKTLSTQVPVRLIQTELPGLHRKKLILFIEKGEMTDSLRPGDRIVAQLIPREITNRGNPHEFDYRSYMLHKHYRYSAYLPSGQYHAVRCDHPPVMIKIARVQRNLALYLKAKTGNNRAFQVVSALSLGYRDELTAETRASFVSTGTMHVLSVSGLHVAMVFLFLDLFLRNLKRRLSGYILYFLMMMISLWGYAFLTGFSPPVQRAAIMFSFILAGNSLKRPAAIANSIAASAFFILFFNPDLIFDVGFQLSFTAVTGIVFFYPRFNSLVQSDQWFIRRPWQLLCVSLAAQLGTFPLTIYYFNQFPLYFWLSNFVVVPAAYLILFLTGSFFALSGIDPVAVWVARLLNAVTDLTLYLLDRIAALPFAVIGNISVSSFQFLLLMMTLAMLMMFIAGKRHRWLFGILTAGVLFSAAGVTQKCLLFNQQKVIVYHSNEKAIHLIHGRNNYIVAEKPPEPHLYRNVLLKLKLNDPVFMKWNADSIRYDVIIRKSAIQFSDRSLLPYSADRYPSLTNTGVLEKGLNDLKKIKGKILFLQAD